METSKKRLTEIDGLRGIACLGIAFVFHYRGFWNQYSLIAPYIDYFCRFVEVFLMISGFMMTYNYSGISSQINFLGFFKRRYFKLMPIYLMTFLHAFLLD